MADSPGGKEPNLELPSFGFGKRRRKKQDQESAPEPEPAVEETQPIAAQPAPEPEPQPEPEAVHEPEPTVVHEPVQEPVHEPTLQQEAVAAPVATQEVRDEPEVHDRPDQQEEPEQPREPQRRAEKEPFHLPRLPMVVAALIAGLVTGVVGIALAYGATNGCEAVRGVGSCGGIGVVALLVVLAVEVVVGAALLRAWQVTEPTSTAFLAVGLVAVLAMLFFLPSIDDASMLVVIPVLTAIAFVFSAYLTRSFVDSAPTD